ncbi:acyl-CoA dehydrogenase family protein [Streptomyces hesseae]|uniref:Acyl-CoA dehydrogenase family protein n=1 Tax=Streptomyces hesseae TaxID=3075519 RepID=A0ABU2SLS6_9ACTN|nr:acyl-CoA dehydrogenase family protein [Streptomyces sp. DSM 40473]MDT0448829.1 acyl-CoA dehydrogenase family protein [Streptomyces sp. DSM 40473]
MDAAFSDEQEEIRRTLREVLAKHAGMDAVRAAVLTPAGHDTDLWRRLAERPGLPGLAVERRYGGAGCGLLELALACEETGRVLLPSPLLATSAVTAPLIAALGTPEQRNDLLPRLVSGELTGTLAVPRGTLPDALGLTVPGTLGLTGPGGVDRSGDSGRSRNSDRSWGGDWPWGGDWAGGGRSGGVQARRSGDGWRLYGEARQVLDGHSAGLLLIAARTGGYADARTLLFVVRPGTASGVTRTRLTSLDETRPQARIELRDTEAEPLGLPGSRVRGEPAEVGAGVAAVLAAEAVGAADRALERTVGYARVREQFGRPIGSFQAVKHRLADLYVAVQAARSAAYYAAWSGRPAAAGLALAQALETARKVAGEAVQLHGGIGVTWEHEAQLYFKRATSDELLFGPVDRLRARAAGTAGLFDTTGPFGAPGERETVVL